MKRAVVTGATGFVGASLTRRLLKEGHEAHLLVRPEHAGWRLDEICPHVRVHTVTLADADALVETIKCIRPDWVFHLAAYGAYSSQTDLQRMIQTNFIGTVNLVEACVQTGFEVFVNTGSSSEYGFKDHPPSEQEWIDPNSHYAMTKAAATHFCRYTALSTHMPIITLRLYSVYGPYEEPTRLIPTLIMYGLRGRLPPLVNPSIARDYVYTEDVNDAYLLAATQTGQVHGAVYNVGAGVQTTLQEVVDVACQTMNIPAEPQWGAMPNRHWDTSVWVADNRAIQSALGWKPRYSFTEGFRETVAWFRSNPAIQQFYAARLALAF